MSLTYAGVSLLVPPPELLAWIEGNISPREVYEFDRMTWPGPDRETFPTPPLADSLRPIKLNALYWPQGASRWAVGHFLTTDSGLAAIRTQINPASGYRSRDLVIAEGDSTTNKITTSLWMLPARPLQQLVGADAKDAEGFWLLTLVDDRYFWWDKASQITVTGGTTTWAQLYTSIGSALGVTINADTVASEYLKPSSDLTSRYQHIPQLLDAAAASVGQRICRKLDGTVYAQAPRTAKARIAVQFPTTVSPRQAGGQFAFDPSKTNDLNALAPASVTVAFPRSELGLLTPKRHAAPVTLSSLTLVEYGNTVGRPHTEIVHSNALAEFPDDVEVTPDNDAELTTLAEAIARDWYLWRSIAKLDWKFAGVMPWTPEAAHDCEWAFGAGECSTRVMRASHEHGHLHHHGTAGAPSDDAVYADYLTIGTALILGNTPTDYGADQADLVLSRPLTIINPTIANVNITNFATTGIANGTTVVVWNISTTNKLTIILTGQTTLVLRPRQMQIYVCYSAAWYPFQQVLHFHQHGPTTINANQDNYALVQGPHNIYNFAPSATYQFTGFAGGFNGAVVVIYNSSSSYSILLPHQSGSSSAGNKIFTATQTTLAIPPKTFQVLVHDGSNWYPQQAGGHAAYAPANPGANQNNYALPLGPAAYSITPTANISITGLAITGIYSGATFTIYNAATAFTLTLPHQSGSSSAGNLFYHPSQTSLQLPPRTMQEFAYDGTDYRPVLNHQHIEPTAPSAIGSSQNNYALAFGQTFFELSSTGAFDFTGFANGYRGRWVYLYNSGANTWSVPDLSGSSSAANQVATSDGATLAVAAKRGFWLYHNGTNWRVMSTPQTTGSSGLTHQWTDVQTKTGDFTAGTSEILYLIDTGAANITATLPTAVGNKGLTLGFKLIDSTTHAYTAIIDGDGTETIDGAQTLTIELDWGAIVIASDGANWQRVSTWPGMEWGFETFSGTNVTARNGMLHKIDPDSSDRTVTLPTAYDGQQIAVFKQETGDENRARLTDAYGAGVHFDVRIEPECIVLARDSVASRWRTISHWAPYDGCYTFASAQTIGDATWTAVEFDNESFDDNKYHDTVTNNTRLTAQANRSGQNSTTQRFIVGATIRFESDATGLRGARIRSGGGFNFAEVLVPACSGDVTIVNLSALVTLADGEYVEIEAYQSSGGDLDVTAASSGWIAKQEI